MTIQTTLTRLGDLLERRHHRNPKEHDLDGIIASMKRWGFTAPPVLDETSGVLVAGHGRCEALYTIKMSGSHPLARIDVAGDGEWLVPTLSIPFADDEDRDAYVIADNRLTEAGGWDDAKLASMLASFKRVDLASMGFTRRSYDSLLARFRPRQKADEVATPDPPREPVTKPGDIWKLGDHLLFCADCTTIKPEQVIIGRTGFGFTSPPYNVSGPVIEHGDQVGTSSRYLDHEDQLSDDAYAALLRGSLRLLLSSTRICVVNLQSLAANKRVIARWVAEHADNLVDRIVWSKGPGRPAMSLGVLNSRFEDLWIFSSENLPNRVISTGDFHGTVSNVYEGGAQTDNEFSDVHAATMPTHLAEFGLAELGFRADFVVEPFAGTGTTLVVADQLGKRCAAIERSPAYCDVIIERWKKLRGGLVSLA